jgi:uncharacterized protein (TIGR02246 family)
MNADEQAVAAVLAAYQDALNRSDTDAVMDLYASDGVFMAQNSPSSIGAAAVRKASKAVFDKITLKVDFQIAEVKQIGPSWAFARTNPAGRVKINATGAGGPEANQELFLFQKIGGAWRIARYCFSTTNTPEHR